MQSTRDPPENKRFTQVENEGVEKILSENRSEKKARVAILLSDKIDIRTKTIIRVKKVTI